MTNKRPSIIGDLDLAPAPPKKVASRAPKNAAVVDIARASSQTAQGRDVQHTSVYIPRAAHERLREIAFHERVKIHDLLMEGIDAVITARGHQESARRDAKAS